jgi:hypothetical protein
MNNEMNRVVKELELEKTATGCLPSVPLGVVTPGAGTYANVKIRGELCFSKTIR